MSNEQMRAEFATFEDWLASPIPLPTCNGEAKLIEYARHAFNAGRATSGAASGEVVAWMRPAGMGPEFTDDAALAGYWMRKGSTVTPLVAKPAEQSAPPVPRMDADLLAIAGVMSNTLFNMAQQTGHTLTSDDTALFDSLRKQWDSAASRGRAQGGITSEISDERILEIAAEQDYGDEDPKCILRLARALLTNQSASTAHNCPIQTPYGPAECFECAPGQADTVPAKTGTGIAALSKEKP